VKTPSFQNFLCPLGERHLLNAFPLLSFHQDLEQLFNLRRTLVVKSINPGDTIFDSAKSQIAKQ